MHIRGADFQKPLSTYSLKDRLSQSKHSKIKDPKVYFQCWQLHTNGTISMALYASSFKGKYELQPLLDIHSLWAGPFFLPVLRASWGGRDSSQLCCPWAFLPMPLRQRSVNPFVRQRWYITLLSSLIHRCCVCVFFSWYRTLECPYLPTGCRYAPTLGICQIHCPISCCWCSCLNGFVSWHCVTGGL